VDGWRTCFWVVGGQYAFGWLVNMLLGGWRTCYGWSICFWLDGLGVWFLFKLKEKWEGWFLSKCGATPVQLRLCGAQHGGLAVSTLQLALVRKILILNKKWQKFKCASAFLSFFVRVFFHLSLSFVFVHSHLNSLFNFSLFSRTG